MIDLILTYKDNHYNHMLIIFDKKSNKYKYINLTKEYICSCEFDSEERAIQDLDNYPIVMINNTPKDEFIRRFKHD